MANLEELKQKAYSVVSAATEMAQDAAAFAGEKAGALADYAGDKAALVSEKRRLAANYQALGEWYAAQCVDGAPEAVADIVRAIHASQEKIAELCGSKTD